MSQTGWIIRNLLNCFLSISSFPKTQLSVCSLLELLSTKLPSESALYKVNSSAALYLQRLSHYDCLITEKWITWYYAASTAKNKTIARTNEFLHCFFLVIQQRQRVCMHRADCTQSKENKLEACF